MIEKIKKKLSGELYLPDIVLQTEISANVIHHFIYLFIYLFIYFYLLYHTFRRKDKFTVLNLKNELSLAERLQGR